jgi:hypothetical protein
MTTTPRPRYAWRSAQKKYLSKHGKLNRLRQPLGQWSVSPQQSRQKWEWYLNLRSNTLLHQTDTTIKVHAHRRGRTYKNRSTKIIQTLPKSAIPPGTSQHHTSHKSTRNHRKNKQAKNSNTISTFEDHIATFNPWEKKMLKTKNSNKHRQLAQALLTTKKIDVVSDGGEKYGYGSFGWIIEENKNTQKEEANQREHDNSCSP